MRRTTLLALTMGVASMIATPSQAQFTSQGVSLKSRVTLAQMGATAGNDVWGYTSPSGRQYAIVGCNNKTYFVEVTNPTAPVLLNSFAHTSSTWSDMKVYQQYAYIVSEASGTGIQVVDMSNIDSGVVTLVKTVTNPGRSHNVAIDEYSGTLYTCGSNEGDATTMIFSLANPANPVKIGQWPSAYEHDAQIVTYTSGPYAGKSILFGSSEGRGLDVIDVTPGTNGLVTPLLLSRTPYPNVAYGHQGWLDSSRQYFYMDDELDEQNFGFTTNTRLFDVSNIAAPQLVGTFTSGVPAIDHNQYTKGNLLFQANYRSGLRIFDISNRTAPVHIGFYDSFPGSDANQFNGAWSVYPYFNNSTVLLNDIESGLFILDAGAVNNTVTFNYPVVKPARIDPDGGTTVTVTATPSNVTIAEMRLYYREDATWNYVVMTQQGGNFVGAFPATVCGSTVDYYVDAVTTTGAHYSDPMEGSGKPYMAVSQDSESILFADNMDTNTGWTSTNTAVTDGGWARGVPAGGARSDPPSAFGGSGSAWVTGPLANADLDGGPTVLTSPTFSAVGADKWVRFAYWYANDDGDDPFVMQLSNNGGTSWTTIYSSVAPTSGWKIFEYRIADAMIGTANMKMRFTANDNPNNSVTEAGIDQFEVFQVVCVRPPISGVVGLEGRIATSAGQPVTFTIKQGGNIVDSVVASLDASGAFNFTTNARGNVDIYAKAGTFLQKKIAGIVLTDTGVNNLVYSLKNGDVDGNNAVELPDYLAMIESFDLVATDPGWNGNADLDGSGMVDLGDYLILVSNFDQSGD